MKKTENQAIDEIINDSEEFEEAKYIFRDKINSDEFTFILQSIGHIGQKKEENSFKTMDELIAHFIE